MSELKRLVADELAGAIDPRVREVAKAIAAQHGEASRAVFFYGSCLREHRLDGLMLDFYLIVSDYSSAYSKRWLAIANRQIPPNVFYFEHQGLRSKYAVMSEADFEHECSKEAWTVSTAARFAQPSRLAWSKGEESTERAILAVSRAAPTLLEWTVPLSHGTGVLALWKQAFALTFGSELRAERIGRSSAIVDVDPERYERIGLASLKVIGREPVSRERALRWWRSKQRHGKLYSLARLAKASFTFHGGADYLSWKINRHGGTNIRLSPWQKRHPLLAAIGLLPRLIRSGAVR